MNVSGELRVSDSRLQSSRLKIADYQRGKNLENLLETIRGEGISQPQRIAIEIISPRDRATLRHCVNSYAELQGDLQK